MRFSPSSPSSRASLYCAGMLAGISCNAFFSFKATLAEFMLLGVVIFAFRKAYLPALLVIFLCGATFSQVVRARERSEFITGRPLQLTGIIDDPPDIRHDKILLNVLPDQNSAVLLRGSHSGRIQVTAPRYPEWNYGDRISLKGTVRAPEAFSGFNYPLYLERYHIYGLISRPGAIRLVESNQGNPVRAWLYRLRTLFENAIRRAIPEPESSFLGGILLGSKRSIPDSIQAELKQTGTSHIIAISGANITILLGILLVMLPVYSARSHFLATLVIGMFVAILTGASASVLRGAAVAILGAYLKMRGRIAWATPFLLFSAALLMVHNPLLVADPGFQLSFGAFAGLAYLGSPLVRLLARWRLTCWLPEIVRSPLAETIAATIGTAPLSLLIFHQFSLLGLVVNPLILWLITPITLLGLCLLIVSPIHLLAATVSLPLWLLLRSVLTIIAAFARIPVGIVSIPQ